MEARAREGPKGAREDGMMEEGMLRQSSSHEEDLGGVRVACAATGRWRDAAMVVAAHCGGAVLQGADHGMLSWAWMLVTQPCGRGGEIPMGA